MQRGPAVTQGCHTGPGMENHPLPSALHPSSSFSRLGAGLTFQRLPVPCANPTDGGEDGREPRPLCCAPNPQGAGMAVPAGTAWHGPALHPASLAGSGKAGGAKPALLFQPIKGEGEKQRRKRAPGWKRLPAPAGGGGSEERPCPHPAAGPSGRREGEWDRQVGRDKEAAPGTASCTSLSAGGQGTCDSSRTDAA